MPWSNIDNELKQFFNHLMIYSQEYNLYIPIKAMPEKIVSVFGVYFISIEINISKDFNAFQKTKNCKSYKKISKYFQQLNKLMEMFIKKLTSLINGVLLSLITSNSVSIIGCLLHFLTLNTCILFLKCIT